MNTIPKVTYRPVQKLHPLSLLAQFISRASDGCLQITSGGSSWFIYLEQGKLVYASDLLDPFGRLDRHLRRMSLQAPSLVSAVRVQVRLMFETLTTEQPTPNNDYRAICWLVEQQHLTPEQAAALIETMAREVIEAFLPVQSGSYEFVEEDLLAEFPKFCQLDLRALVEECQSQIRRRQASVAIPVSERPLSERLNLTANMAANMTPLPKPFQQPAETNSIELPAAPAPTNQAPSPQPSHSVSTSNAKTYTIACIDDSPTVLQAINSFLDDKSFSVVLISDPVKALMQIIRSKPDLILLDVTMPNLDGYELCSLLRKHPSFRGTPIIMVTGNTGFIDRAKARLVGASGYLTKPFTQSDLIKMVFKHLS
ncbi:response regulator [Leptolyngbya sp. NK1-12]|uniref:Response regulator n=1 Tax=Leptolyngbya sp. NK1-12 TaxID=2547451 RepID=A0AA97AE08_9CYAN|nr:response regulator [Leptolyngbya sp. NK1-12]